MGNVIKGWKVIYNTGKIFGSNDYSWKDIPTIGLVAIFYYQDCGNQNITMSKVVGRDFYDFDGTRFYKSDDITALPNISIKRGKYIDDSMYHTLVDFYKTEDLSKWVLVQK